MKRYFILLIGCLFLLPLSLAAFEPTGPLHGKDYYVPFLPFYSFPGDGASVAGQGVLGVTLSQYYVQDMVTEFHEAGTQILKERFVDYEGYILEPTITYTPIANVETGITSRVHFYYGGIFDPVFEWFHGLFGFPNGGRESYPQGDVYINLVTTSGIDLHLDKPEAALGDTDLFAKWNFLSLSFTDLAFFGALKLPTGSMERISGSGYADLAFSFLSDFYAGKRFAFYLENGIVLPGEMLAGNSSYPLPIYHLLAGTEFMVTANFSLHLQFNLNTSPIAEGVTVPENISYTAKLTLPMTDLQFGVKWRIGACLYQFSLEEDAFTNNGADLIANFTVSRNF